MAVMARQAKYHRFGRAIRRIMNAENVQASSQDEAAEQLTEFGGYKCDQRLLSNYMRTVKATDKDTGVEYEKPRTLPPPEFVFAWRKAYPLTREQELDLLDSWLDIMPEDRREALLTMCRALSDDDVPSEALEEMMDVESPRTQQDAERGTGDGETGNRQP